MKICLGLLIALPLMAETPNYSAQKVKVDGFDVKIDLGRKHWAIEFQQHFDRVFAANVRIVDQALI